MIVRNYKDIPAAEVEEGAKNTTIRWLIAEPEGAPHFYMRLFEIGYCGNTPHHTHEWEHEIFILEGNGKLVGDDTSHLLKPGDAVFVPGGEIHHLENEGETILKFLCLIPVKK